MGWDRDMSLEVRIPVWMEAVGKWRPESGLLEGIDLVTSTSCGETRKGFQSRCLSCPPAAKEREVCSWQKAQLVQRPGSRTQSAVLEAASGAVWPGWAVSWVRGE